MLVVLFNIHLQHGVHLGLQLGQGLRDGAEGKLGEKSIY